MIFLGLGIYGNGDDAFPVGGSASFSSIGLKNGMFDYIYLSKNPDEFSNSSTPSVDWTENTLLFADFDNMSLDGSNFQYESDIITVQLKRRETGYANKQWITLYEKAVDSKNLNFTYIDKYARGREAEYEYAIVPVLKNGTELPYIKTTAVSNFGGAVITDGDTSYHILLDPAITETDRNRQSSVITTLNRKYPFVFFGGESNYTTGSFSGTAIRYLGNDVFDVANSHWYREDMIDWLTNGEPKILKIEDGRIWMVVIDGNVKASNPDHPDKVSLSFDFTEIGDVNDENDMLDKGFVNRTEEIITPDSFDITYNLYYVTLDNTPASISNGGTYKTKLSPDTDYEVSGVVVMMGGLNITNTVYDKKAHEVNIPSVSGNITIIASATRTRIVAQSFSLTESKITLIVKNNHKLEWTTYPAGAAQNIITWKSSNESVATIKDGVIEAKSAGNTTITAVMDNLTATCAVTVTAS